MTMPLSAIMRNGTYTLPGQFEIKDGPCLHSRDVYGQFGSQNGLRSFETVGYDVKSMNFPELLERALICFRPAEFSMSLHSLIDEKNLDKDLSLFAKGYSLGECELEMHGNGEAILYSNFSAIRSCGSPKSMLRSSWSEDKGVEKN